MPFVMFDSIDAAAIPDPAKVPFDATAGYVNGRWPSSAAILKRFPNLPHVTIAVTAAVDAMCLDVEPGDADPSQVPAWLDRQYARGLRLPIIYCNTSQIGAVRSAVGSRPFLWWGARYATPRVAALISGSDATQWNDVGPNGENVDQTVMSDRFYQAIGGTVALTPDDIAAVAKAVLDSPIVVDDKGTKVALRDAFSSAVRDSAENRRMLGVELTWNPPAPGTPEVAGLAKLQAGQVADALAKKVTG